MEIFITVYNYGFGGEGFLVWDLIAFPCWAEWAGPSMLRIVENTEPLARCPVSVGSSGRGSECLVLEPELCVCVCVSSKMLGVCASPCEMECVNVTPGSPSTHSETHRSPAPRTAGLTGPGLWAPGPMALPRLQLPRYSQAARSGGPERPGCARAIPGEEPSVWARSLALSAGQAFG